MIEYRVSGKLAVILEFYATKKLTLRKYFSKLTVTKTRRRSTKMYNAIWKFCLKWNCLEKDIKYQQTLFKCLFLRTINKETFLKNHLTFRRSTDILLFTSSKVHSWILFVATWFCFSAFTLQLFYKVLSWW